MSEPTPSETALSAEIAAIKRSLDNIERNQRLLLLAKVTPKVPKVPFRERLHAANRRRTSR